MRVRRSKRHSYRTVSTRITLVKTSGDHLVIKFMGKNISKQRCSITGIILKGLLTGNVSDRKNFSRKKKNVHRPFGGVLSHKEVRHKIIRSFLNEELNIVKKMLKTQKKRQQENHM